MRITFDTDVVAATPKHEVGTFHMNNVPAEKVLETVKALHMLGFAPVVTMDE